MFDLKVINSVLDQLKEERGIPKEKIIEAIEARALKLGVLVIKVNPAYTSDLGQLKYQKLYLKKEFIFLKEKK